jgi:glucose-1-phosphate adenylyltransferase
VGRESIVDRAIVDKQVLIAAGSIVGHGEAGRPNRACPDHLTSGLTLIGKGAQLPEGVRIGRNSRIGAFVTESDFGGNVPEGGVVDGPESMH